MSKLQLILLESFVAVGIVTLLFLYFKPKDYTSIQAKLAETALTSPELDQQQKAVVALADTGKGAEVHLRQILVECPKIEVKMSAIFALSQLKDFESGPELFRLLEDFSAPPLLRSAAAATVANLAENKQYFFQLSDPEEKQRDTIARLKNAFEQKKAELQNPKQP